MNENATDQKLRDTLLVLACRQRLADLDAERKQVLGILRSMRLRNTLLRNHQPAPKPKRRKLTPEHLAALRKGQRIYYAALRKRRAKMAGRGKQHSAANTAKA